MADSAAIPLHCCVSYANGRGYHDAACPRKPDAANAKPCGGGGVKIVRTEGTRR